ncbi:YjcQ family protein [Porcipelethomonas sp.]|uniref:YjcQ family protein n=1 Tax=Porcipelethomonas sp. TaxID=2981675 RepID=UPI003EF5E35A
MNNFTVIYKILKALEQSMDYEEFDDSLITPEILGVSRERRNKLLIEMQRNGYITGLIFFNSLGQHSSQIREPLEINITLKGLEYLSDNTMMKKAANMLKGIKDTIPGI